MRDSSSRRCNNTYAVVGEIAFLHITKNDGTIISTKFDAKLLNQISRYHWHYTSAGYVRTIKSQGHTLMHRMLMELHGIDTSKYHIDHINGDSLDNTLCNLRCCTAQENCRNTRNRRLSNSCDIIGVRKDDRCRNSWRAQIYLDKQHHIEKTFKDYETAVIQRLKWELQYFGEYAPQIELIKSQYAQLLIKEKD